MLDEAGNNVIPDAVRLRRADGSEAECWLRPDGYGCPEKRAGTAQLVLSVRGAVVSEASVRVPAHDCVLSPARHDFVAR